jgi:methylated-DNA-[protein]-cysteine S-methyltransferase
MNGQTTRKIYWTLIIHQYWMIYLGVTSKGLCFVGSQNRPIDELADWVESRFPGAELVPDDGRCKPYAIELLEYLQGERQSFSVPFDLHGTPFQLAVWQALREIPYGETQTYSDIADRIRRTKAVRAVGAAIGANPLLITVPCHRVIGKSGALTGYRGGLEMKTRLLELEKESASVEGRTVHA